MRRLTWILIAIAALSLVVVPSVAFANNGPHGGYLKDTDLCAQCHRAHTAPSSVTWIDQTNQSRSALLLSGATSMETFCFACHDAGAQGADTNVVDGVYEGSNFGDPGGQMLSGPFGRPMDLDPENVGNTAIPYANVNSSQVMVTSSHLTNGGKWGAYGGGTFASMATATATGEVVGQKLGMGQDIVMDCSTCHDPHGTSNYRLLKASVYGNPVGGYGANNKPNAYVVSNEEGFPIGNPTDGYGFALGQSYTETYTPNYTDPLYAKSPDLSTEKGMTGWCIGCHTVYSATTSKYNAGDGAGYVTRHRHPMNVELAEGRAATGTTLTTSLPLDGSLTGSIGTGVATVRQSDWVECLTCHNAHGTTATMTGFAAPNSTFSEPTTSTVIKYVVPDSALLKLKNRQVCEDCHNK